MQEKIYLQNCGEDDVLSYQGKMWKLGSIKDGLRNVFPESKLGQHICLQFKMDLGSRYVNENGKSREIPISYEEWFLDGIDCEVLKIGAKGWQKGKVKIHLQVSLEFYPDEPEIEEIAVSNETESPLDDIRRMIKQDS